MLRFRGGEVGQAGVEAVKPVAASVRIGYTPLDEQIFQPPGQFAEIGELFPLLINIDLGPFEQGGVHTEAVGIVGADGLEEGIGGFVDLRCSGLFCES